MRILVKSAWLLKAVEWYKGFLVFVMKPYMNCSEPS